MSTVRFLVDEDVPGSLFGALVRWEPGIEMLRVGQLSAPPRGTKDPGLLLFAEEHGYALLTRDKGTMPVHVQSHTNSGRHTWGVFILREGFRIMTYVDDLILIWSACEAEELRDRITWLPM